ncbi:MAG: GNAT family N-acetyltransferase [Chloroflexi bacterium]|nr:GNAT family N-acetyltransferase [Chloroflexota bacterium]
MDDSQAGHLERLDSIARQLVARATQIRFQLARTEEERAAVFRLRFETVAKQGWASLAEFPEGLERDAYDDAALLVVGWHDDTLAATARLVFPDASRPLPIEEEFELSSELPSGVVDLRRAVVAAPYRSRRHTVYAALLARCWLEVRDHGLHRICGAASPRWLNRFRQLGLPVQVLGPAQQYWGEERYPLFLDGVELAQAVADRPRLSL